MRAIIHYAGDYIDAITVQAGTLEELKEIAESMTGKEKPIEFKDRIVAVVQYRDGSVVDVVRQIKK